MITYESICDKLGFDLFEDNNIIKSSDHEDDSKESPFAILKTEELRFLSDYLIKNRHKLTRYVVR